MMERRGDYIEITTWLAGAASEFMFQFSRSSGPGGQNVNRREMCEELLLDLGIPPAWESHNESGW